MGESCGWVVKLCLGGVDGAHLGMDEDEEVVVVGVVYLFHHH